MEEELTETHDERHLPPWAWLTVLGVVVLVALGLRLLLLLVREQVIPTEGQVYIRIAQNLAEGRGLLGIREQGVQLFYPPLYPWLMSLLVRIGMSPGASAHVINLLAGAGLVVPVAIVARAAFGSVTGLTAGLLTAIHPVLVVAGANTFAEPLFLLCLAGATCLVAQGPRRDIHLAAAGALAGLAYLVRAEAVALAVLAVPFLWLTASGSRAARLRPAAVFGAVFFLFIASYAGHLWYETGRPRLEAKSPENMLLGMAYATGADQDVITYGIDPTLEPRGVFQRSNLDVIREADTTDADRLGFVASIGVRNVAHGFERLGTGQSLGQPFLGVLIVLAVFGSVLSREQFVVLAIPIGLCAFSLAALASLHLFYMRYLVPLLPWLLALAAAGVLHLHKSVRRTSAGLHLRPVWSRALGITAAGIAVVGLCGFSARSMGEMSEFSDAWSSHRREHKQAGERLRGPLGHSTIVDVEPTIAYYSGAVFRFWPHADSLTAVRFLEANSPDYIVLRPDTHARWSYVRSWYEHGPPPEHTSLAFTVGETRVYHWQPSSSPPQSDRD